MSILLTLILLAVIVVFALIDNKNAKRRQSDNGAQAFRDTYTWYKEHRADLIASIAEETASKMSTMRVDCPKCSSASAPVLDSGSVYCCIVCGSRFSAGTHALSKVQMPDMRKIFRDRANLWIFRENQSYVDGFESFALMQDSKFESDNEEAFAMSYGIFRNEHTKDKN